MDKAWLKVTLLEEIFDENPACPLEKVDPRGIEYIAPFEHGLKFKNVWSRVGQHRVVQISLV